MVDQVVDQDRRQQMTFDQEQQQEFDQAIDDLQNVTEEEGMAVFARLTWPVYLAVRRSNLWGSDHDELTRSYPRPGSSSMDGQGRGYCLLMILAPILMILAANYLWEAFQ